MAGTRKIKDGFPYATMALLLACAGATLAFDRSDHADIFICYPREPLRALGAPVFLSLFTHEGFPHLFLNCAVLAPVGRGLESRLGAAGLLALFFLCGMAGIAGQAAVTDVGTIGASGAVCGLLVMDLIFRGPGREAGFTEFLLAAWIAMDLFALPSQLHGDYGAIGHASHLAGAAAGLGLAFATRRGPAPSPRSGRASSRL